MFKDGQQDKRVKNLLGIENIHWQFDPSAALWLCGQIDRLIDLMKRVLYKKIGGGCLIWHETQEVLQNTETALKLIT